MKKVKYYSFLFFISICSIAKPSMAFTSCPPPINTTLVGINQGPCVNGHYDITLAGLAGISSNLRPSIFAIIRVGLTAVFVDLHETTWGLTSLPPAFPKLIPDPNNYVSSHHFDQPPASNNLVAFKSGMDYLNKERTDAVNSFKNCQVPAGLNALGKALHALQDAYSHSNYVDGMTMDDQEIYDQQLRNGTFTQLPVSLKLTIYGFAIPPNTDPENPEGNCTKEKTIPYCHKFYAKDYPSENDEALNNYKWAFDAAVNATTDFVIGIIKDVGVDKWQDVVNYGNPLKSSACNPNNSCSINPSGICNSNSIEGITSGDPNDKAGSQGVGPQQYISGATPLRYAIEFSNMSTATAPAAKVVVTDQLNLTDDDLSTFNLGPISVANQLVTPPPGTDDFATILDLRPANNLLLAIVTHLDLKTGLLTWTFESLDPTTNKPPEDPTVGFLPPGAEGSIFFTVMPKADLATNTKIENFATIVFDANASMNTPTWFNTIDNTPPVSHVHNLPAQETQSDFTVEWAGTDEGSGIKDFSVFAAEDDGVFNLLLTDTTSTSVSFHGNPGHKYRFYSLARDLTGNREVKQPVDEAVTTVMGDTTAPTTTAVPSPQPNNNGWNKSDVVITLTAADNSDGSGVKQIQYALNGAQTLTDQIIAGNTTKVTVSKEGTTTLTYFATDNAGNVEPTKSLTIKIDRSGPTISGMPVNCTLWPPNKKMVQVATVSAKDNLAGLVKGSFKVTGVSNEPSDPKHPDIVISPNASGDFVIQLNADRSGNGSGRIYTLTTTASDLADNTSTVNATCKVPHDQGH